MRKEHCDGSVWKDGNITSKATPYDYLAAAIVRQAAFDYVKVLRKLWKKQCTISQRRKLLLDKAELEGFFYSAWYASLTEIEPEMLIVRCKAFAVEKEKQAIKDRNRARIRRMIKEQSIQSRCADEVTADESVKEV